MARAKGFSTDEAAFLTGLTPRQVGYWARTRLVVPSVSDAAGRGNHRRFDLRDVLTLGALAAFRDRGVSLQGLRRVQHFLRARETAELQEVYARLVFLPGNAREVLLAKSADEIVSLLEKPGQHVMPVVVDLAHIFRGVTARVVDIEEARRKRAEREAEKRARKGAKSAGRGGRARAGGAAA